MNANDGRKEAMRLLSPDQASKLTYPKVLRWGWLGIAILGIITTPEAIAAAVDLARSDHRLIFILPFAFVIRFGTIWMFLKLWWKTKPTSSSL